MLSAEFLRSAAHFKDLPSQEGPEVCVLGRSNVGKSSFINHVFGNKGLAKVSRKPGKTTLANFYRVSDGTVWVDLPGYGYAKASRDEKSRWAGLIKSYCEKRTNLRGAIWLLDIRHPATAMDREAFTWLHSLGMAVLPILTKSDKLSRSQQQQNAGEYRHAFAFPALPVIYSIVDNTSRERFESRYETWKKSLGIETTVPSKHS